MIQDWVFLIVSVGGIGGIVAAFAYVIVMDLRIDREAEQYHRERMARLRSEHDQEQS